MARELWFLQSTAAAPLLGCTTVTEVSEPRSAGHSRLSSGQVLMPTLPAPSKPASHARSYSPVSNRNRYCATTTPPGLSSPSPQTFSPSPGSRSWSSRTDSPGGLWSSPAGPILPPRTHNIRLFCRYFRDVGVPLRLRTDGGPQFTSTAFRNFTERWGVYHAVSSPHYPPSNGHAEAAVKSVKHLILKTAPNGNIDSEDFDREEWQARTEDCDRRAVARAEEVKAQYDQHARPLPRLYVGQTVRVQDPTSHRWDKVGVVMGCGTTRDFEVRLPSGRVWWRNHRFLRPVPTPSDDTLPHIPVSPCSDEKIKSPFIHPPVTPRRSQRLKEKESARD
ncbi:Gag-Pro-Pol polyprotein [Chionoecetes opilio]|uniref:Gag-Pro-Pol polyprotein n=1 Tax=Chionoecetes opilio TaxID=41210 RepID=A0A8J4YMH7_CHIOP|nr:Gag-Pro-Pol polyprotein [Chionoecetes opilio]